MKINIIGLGLSINDLTSAHLKIIEESDILIGGKRHLEFFKDSHVLKREITKDIKGIIDFIKTRMEKENITVLASGDPLFYGIGPLLIKSLGAENVCIYPNITSVGAAFSRIKESWHDAHIISIHGRFNEQSLIDALSQKDKIALLTDSVHNPSWLTGFLLEKGFKDFSMCVLENLGADSEKVEWYELNQAARKVFSEPNVIILKRILDQKMINKLYPGMPDEYFEHENGLITKAEVRALALSKLRLCSPDYIMWDLGAGSGSISIESSIFIKTGRVFAVEQNEQRVKQIQINKERFHVDNLEIIKAVLPQGIENLPAPDRIFIGGGGKNLEKIIRAAAAHMKEDGLMLVNTVLIQNIETALNTFQSLGFQTEITQIQINSGKAMPWGQRLQAQNPVWIVTGMSKEKEL